MPSPYVELVDTNGYLLDGATATPVAAGTGTTAVVVKATPGRLCRVVVTAAGTAGMSVYDNATAASGTILAALPATTTVGQQFEVRMPAVNGITVGTVSGSPAVTVCWS